MVVVWIYRIVGYEFYFFLGGYILFVGFID